MKENILSWFDELTTFMQDGKLAPWAEILPRQMQEILIDKEHGDQQRWLDALNSLPVIDDVAADLTAHDLSLSSELISTEQQQQVHDGLKGLMPWRKGPFRFFDTHIDTEWRSDWKWERVLPHLSPLKNRVVLDVGCGSGYHMWRMLGEGAYPGSWG